MVNTVKVDGKQIEEETGLKFDTPEDALYYVRSKLEFLTTNNKNLTKQQDGIIYDLYSIISNIEID